METEFWRAQVIGLKPINACAQPGTPSLVFLLPLGVGKLFWDGRMGIGQRSATVIGQTSLRSFILIATLWRLENSALRNWKHIAGLNELI